MTQQFPLDAANDVRGKLRCPRRVAPVDRADDREGGDLDQILAPIRCLRKPARQLPGKRQVALDHPAAVGRERPLLPQHTSTIREIPNTFQESFRIHAQTTGYLSLRSSMPGRSRHTHRVCFCALAVVLGLVAAPAALGDDGTPAPIDPGTVAPAQPQVPDQSQTPVVPVVSPEIPPVVPGNSGATAATSSDPAPSQTDPVQSQNQPAAAPSVTAPVTPSGGNTTSDNSSGITVPSTQSAPTTIVWNWTWNCKDDPTSADLPQTTPDTTTIVLNWTWDCPDVVPPPVDIASVTTCVGCNISISVRIASPGDSAGVTQSTQVDAAAIASGVAEATQAASQTVVPPQPPVVAPSAPPQSPAVTTLAAAAAPAAPTPPAAPSPPAVTALAVSAPAVALPPASDSFTEDTPRHGAPDFGAAPASAVHGAVEAAQVIRVHKIALTTVVRAISVVHVHTVVRSHERAVSPARKAPFRFPPAPSAPTLPIALAAASGEGHGAGSFAPTALAAGVVGIFLLTFLAYAAPGLQTARPRPAQAHPHPPG